jgi:hypothetical protein
MPWPDACSIFAVGARVVDRRGAGFVGCGDVPGSGCFCQCGSRVTNFLSGRLPRGRRIVSAAPVYLPGHVYGSRTDKNSPSREHPRSRSPRALLIKEQFTWFDLRFRELGLDRGRGATTCRRCSMTTIDSARRRTRHAARHVPDRALSIRHRRSGTVGQAPSIGHRRSGTVGQAPSVRRRRSGVVDQAGAIGQRRRR